MKRSRHLLTILWTYALVAGSTVGVAAQDEESQSPPGPGVLVSGELTSIGKATFNESSGWVDGVLRQRDRPSLGQLEMSDARLAGEVTGMDHADRWCSTPCQDEDFADILWGTIEIRNDNGTWVGTSVSTSDMMAEYRGITYIDLIGAGGYEGLSATIFETENEAGAHLWSGVIYPGDQPPDR